MELTGIHHLTAISAAIRENHRLYTQTLGMRLVKRTVNQDDVSAYHLFLCRCQGQSRHRSDVLRLAGATRASRHAQHRSDEKGEASDHLLVVYLVAPAGLVEQFGRAVLARS